MPKPSERAGMGAPERRTMAVEDFEVRSDVDSLVLDGYASVFDAPYDILGGPDNGGWTEVVDRRAFNKTLSDAPDVHLLINHDGLPLANTRSGTMDLATDKKGLRVTARLDRSDPDVQRLAPKMQRGDLREMSFAFRTVRQEWSQDDTVRRLLELNLHKGDVSVVNFGANPATSSTLRQFEELLVEMRSSDDFDFLAEIHRVAGERLRGHSKPRVRVATADPRSY